MIFAGTARGVPTLYIPLLADQQRNAFKSVSAGTGRVLPFKEVTAETLSNAINDVISNKNYLHKAKETARLFNDNLVHPMDEAIFWIEYVIRSKGAKHLKSKAVNMPWYSYLMLDILVLPFVVIFALYCLQKYLRKS